LSFSFGFQCKLDQALNCFRVACHFAAWPSFQFGTSAQVSAVAPTLSDRHTVLVDKLDACSNQRRKTLRAPCRIYRFVSVSPWRFCRVAIFGGSRRICPRLRVPGQRIAATSKGNAKDLLFPGNREIFLKNREQLSDEPGNH
jgi:hypothetical protein